MKFFDNREEIKKLINRCELNDQVAILIKYFEEIKEVRDGMYLQQNELDEILKFKLRNQFNRQVNIRKDNEEQLIRRISELAFSIDTGKEKYNTEIKINILSTLRGINVATASAILTVIYPSKYAIIDRRTWRMLYNEKKTTFTVKSYIKYLFDLRKIGKKYGFTAQEIDLALWQKDIEEG